MQDPSQKNLLKALLLFLKPIARALLSAGIGHREFSEISKAAFVDVATKDYGLRGRPTNISRVAVMTGLTRKEVRRIRDKADAGEETMVVRTTPLAEILHRWYTDPEFVGPDGRPISLPFEGEELSFAALVRKYGGDIPPGAMRTELKRIGAVDESADGSLTILKRSVSGLNSFERLVNGLAAVMYPAGVTLANNSQTDNDETWIHRTSATRYVRKDDLPRLRRICSERLVEFSESIDDLFAAYEALYEGDRIDSPDQAVGIGVFYFEEDKNESDVFR